MTPSCPILRPSGKHRFGPQWLSVYFSKRDSRVWVPKQIPALGWTLNLGQRAGVFWLTVFVIGLPLSVIAIFAFAEAGR